VFAAEGKKAEAHAAYQNALARLAEADKNGKLNDLAQGWKTQSDAVYRELVQQKLDALGGVK
jgi:predicted negative regulator of RcsB-dependent stress response